MAGIGGANFSDRGDSVDLADFFCRLLDRAAMIAAAAVIGALLMGIVRGAFTTVPYRSTARLLLVSEGDEGLSAAIAQTEHLIQDYAELFRTEELHQRAAGALQTEYPPKQLKAMVETEIPEGTHILRLTVSAPEPGEAERIAEAYAECFSQLAQERLNVPAPGLFEAPTKAVRADIPVTMQNCVFGGLAGAAAACSLIALMGLIDDRIRTPEDAERASGAKMLGILTQQRPGLKRKFSIDAAGRKQAALLAEKLLAEAGDRRSFAVAGCCGGEGRSFVSVQLARALAQDGRRVMLVSAGRSGGCHPKWDGKPEFSLGDWLEGRCAPAELARRSDAPGLWVIVRESLVRGGASRVRGEDIRALVGALEAEGFLVVVDAPAVSRSVDAARIAGACSGTVIVVRYGRTRSGELAEAAAILRKPGGPAVGCVINGVRFTTLESRRKFRFWYSVSKRARRK